MPCCGGGTARVPVDGADGIVFTHAPRQDRSSCSIAGSCLILHYLSGGDDKEVPNSSNCPTRGGR